MLTVKNNIEELKELLVYNTEVVSVSVFFGENNQVGIRLTDGKVLYTTNDRVYWKAYYKKKRTITLNSFNQLIPGLNYDNITFYGLFFKPKNHKMFYKELITLAKKLRTELFKTIIKLNSTITKLEDLVGEQKEFIKILPYIEWKYNRKYGNSSWQRRPYHNAKNDSIFDMWKLNFRDSKTLEERRADRMIYKDIKKKNWNKNKFPKLYKKYFDDRTIEYKVLKKDKWRI